MPLVRMWDGEEECEPEEDEGWEYCKGLSH